MYQVRAKVTGQIYIILPLIQEEVGLNFLIVDDNARLHQIQAVRS